MAVDERSLMEEKRQEAEQDLLYTVEWANEAAKVVVGTGISQRTKERTIIASLEDGKNVIEMETVDLSDPRSSTKPQTWTGKDPSLAKDRYEKEEPHVLRVVSEMRRACSGNLTDNDSLSLRFVKRHGITTQDFAYYLDRLSHTESDKTSIIMHPEFMRPLAHTTTAAAAAAAAAAVPDSLFDNKEQAFKTLASDLMKTLKDYATTTTTTSSSSSSSSSFPNIPSKLNMLIYNIFFVDANVVRNISAACYKFRNFLAAKMGNAAVNDGGVRSKLLEAAVTILFTACRHVFESVNNNNNGAVSQFSQVLERRLAAMASRRCNFSPSSAGDKFRVRVCYVMYSYLHRYLRLCSRRVNVCLRSLRSTGLASKRMMAAPQMAEGVGSRRVSSFEVKYDFSMLYKLLSFQNKNILLLSESAFETLESTIAALAVFVNDAKLPISDSNQRSTIPLTGNEVVLPTADGNDVDTIHANWNIAVLNELSQLLTQYLAWLSKNNDEEEEQQPEKLIRVCRAAAAATVTCLRTVGEKNEVIETKLAPILSPVKSKLPYEKAKKDVATAVTNVLTDIVRPNVLNLEKITKKQNNCTVGSILASPTKAGSIAGAAHVFSRFEDYLHDPEDFWGACAPFPPDGEGTDLEGWAKAYNNSSQDVVEDFCDLSVENNSSMQGLLVPPDFALAHLNNNIVNSNTNIKIGGPIWWNNNTAETDAEESCSQQKSYLRPADGVTISIPGRDKLRKSILLKNALRSNMTIYTRPVFDVQFQTNVHFETPRLVLWTCWTCNTAPAVSAAVWNLPSVQLLFEANRATGEEDDIQQSRSAVEDNDNKALYSAVRTIISKKAESNKYGVVDELALAPALLGRAGTAPFKPHFARGIFTPDKRNRSKRSLSSWWTSDATVMERVAVAAEKLFVLTPALLDIHPP